MARNRVHIGASVEEGLRDPLRSLQLPKTPGRRLRTDGGLGRRPSVTVKALGAWDGMLRTIGRG